MISICLDFHQKSDSVCI